MEPLSFFDANVTVGPRRVSPWGVPSAPAQVMARLAECGISEALAAHALALEHHPAVGNARLATDLAGLPGAHPAWVLLPLTTGELGTAAELRRSLAAAGVRACLLYPAEHTYSGAEAVCGSLYNLLEEMRMPVFTRMAPADFAPGDLAAVLAAHPRLRVILRGVHYQADRVLYGLLDRFENLWVETGRYLVFGGLEALARRFGARRLVFGSDAPLMSAGAAVAPILLADLPRADKELIAGGNLRRLMAEVRHGD